MPFRFVLHHSYLKRPVRLPDQFLRRHVQHEGPAPDGLLQPCRVLRLERHAVFQEELPDLLHVHQHKVLAEQRNDARRAQLAQVGGQLGPSRQHRALTRFETQERRSWSPTRSARQGCRSAAGQSGGSSTCAAAAPGNPAPALAHTSPSTLPPADPTALSLLI